MLHVPTQQQRKRFDGDIADSELLSYLNSRLFCAKETKCKSDAIRLRNKHMSKLLNETELWTTSVGAFKHVWFPLVQPSWPNKGRKEWQGHQVSQGPMAWRGSEPTPTTIPSFPSFPPRSVFFPLYSFCFPKSHNQATLNSCWDYWFLLTCSLKPQTPS